jgi:N-acetylneuraminate synthase/N,N'-diacetyllegionaminate synthase
MGRSLSIFGRQIGIEEPSLVIAEIGVNHDGSVARALELVEIAARGGADAVKLQIFRAQSLMHPSSSFAQYQKPQSRESGPAEMLRKYELSSGDVGRVVEKIRRHGMMPLATPFSTSDVATIAELNLPAVKIASPDLVNRPLLMRAAQLGNPLLISTGAANMQEVQEAVQWLREWGAAFVLLHCVSSYPTPDADANLCWIGELATRFEVPVGYSDHTAEMLSGALAVAAGACVIEKHLTYDRSAAGPDHAASAAPAEFAEYVRLIRLASQLRGKSGKRVLPAEADVRRVSRQSLVLCRALRAGESLRREDLIVQRPGTGIPAAMSEQMVGRKILRALEAGTMLQWNMLCDAA